MPAAKMHPDEVDTDAGLVERLLAAQLPHWAGRRIECVESAGTENALYRLGDDLVARLPRLPGGLVQIDKLARFLPRLAPHLPLEIPVPLAKGEPGEGYPFHWTVYPWLEGGLATRERIADLARGRDGAGALRRGAAAHRRHRRTAARAPQLLPRRRARRARGLDAQGDREPPRSRSTPAPRPPPGKPRSACPPGTGAPVWVHGDIKAGNLLAVDGRVRAVIDWGGLGVGDPAVDLIVAWNLLDARSRPLFRAALGVDDATWARGRGWALSVSLVELPYYWDTNPVMVEEARRTLAELEAHPA